MKKMLLCAAALVAVASPAMAGVTISVTSSATDPAFDPGFAPLGQTLLYDFDAKTPAAGNLFGNYQILVAPGVPNQSAAPAGTPAGTKFLSVPNPLSSGTATLLLGQSYSSASFYWGSVDFYNTLEVLGGNGQVLAKITGAQLPPPTDSDGNQTSFDTNVRVNFVATGGDRIAGFRMSSTQFAFETDTYAVGAVVPEPATWAMMLGGFGLMGFAARRSRRAKTVLA
jgi:hypothetical protein